MAEQSKGLADEVDPKLYARVAFLLERVARGEITGLVYVGTSANKRIYEGMVGSIHVRRTCHALTELRLDIEDQHSKGIKREG